MISSKSPYFAIDIGNDSMPDPIAVPESKNIDSNNFLFFMTFFEFLENTSGMHRTHNLHQEDKEEISTTISKIYTIDPATPWWQK